MKRTKTNENEVKMPSLKVKDESLLAFQGDNDSKVIEVEKRRKIVWDTMSEADIYINRVHIGYNAFFVILTAEQMERALEDKVKERFLRKQLEIVAPPEFHAMKTIVVRNLDRNIDNYDEEEIKVDIEKYNVGTKVEEVHKFRTTSKMLKIRMATTVMVNKALKEGIKIVHQAVHPKDIEKETFVRITPCYNCFAYDHLTKECNVEKMTLCAKCAGDDHYQKDCKSLTEKCINCKGDHRTLAARCPRRKEIQKNKGKELREKSRSRSRTNKTTYADKAKTTGQKAGKQTGKQPAEDNLPDFKGYDGLPDNYPVIIMSAITYAHYMEVFFPGSFQETVDEMYRINGLGKVKFPSNIKTAGMKELFSATRNANINPNLTTESTESEDVDPSMMDRVQEELTKERNKLEEEKRKQEREETRNLMEYEEETNKRMREETPEKEREDVSQAHAEWREEGKSKRIKEQKATPKEQREVTRRETEKSLSERKGAVPKEGKKRTTSVGSLQQEEEIDLARVQIELYVPKSASHIDTQSKQGKERIIKLYDIKKAKATWKHSRVTTLMIKNALCRQSDWGRDLIDYIKFHIISDREFEKLIEGNITTKQKKV